MNLDADLVFQQRIAAPILDNPGPALIETIASTPGSIAVLHGQGGILLSVLERRHDVWIDVGRFVPSGDVAGLAFAGGGESLLAVTARTEHSTPALLTYRRSRAGRWRFSSRLDVGPEIAQIHGIAVAHDSTVALIAEATNAQSERRGVLLMYERRRAAGPWRLIDQVGLTETISTARSRLRIASDGQRFAARYADLGQIHLVERNSDHWEIASTIVEESASCIECPLTLSGDTLLSSADTQNGKVAVYEEGTSGWSHTATLTRGSDYFGISLVLAGDEAFIGELVSGSGSSQIHVFRRVAGNWIAAQILTAMPQLPFDYFGFGGIEISGDHLLVGVSGAGGESPTLGGVQRFARAVGEWTAAELIYTRGLSPGSSGFGGMLDLYANRLAIRSASSGVVTYTPDGTAWIENQTLQPVAPLRPFPLSLGPDLLTDAGSVFAHSAAGWQFDGTLRPTQLGNYSWRYPLVAGDVIFFVVPQLIDGGLLLVFERRAAGWEETQRILVPELVDFGGSADTDGTSLAVGSLSGEVRVFGRNPEQTQWIETARLRAPGTETSFGSAVAIDGDTLAIRAQPADQSSHLVFIYRRTHGGWIPETQLVFPRTWFANGPLCLSGGRLAVSEYGDTRVHFVFSRTGTDWSLAGTIPFSGWSPLVLDGGHLAVGHPDECPPAVSDCGVVDVYGFAP